MTVVRVAQDGVLSVSEKKKGLRGSSASRPADTQEPEPLGWGGLNRLGDAGSGLRNSVVNLIGGPLLGHMLSSLTSTARIGLTPARVVTSFVFL